MTEAETKTEAWTIKRLLDWTTEFFQKYESESPRLEAEILLAEALECERIQLYTRFNEVPTEPALGNYRAWVKRRAAGEPVAYLVGHREFYSLRFRVDSHVLIPRPETEHAVVETIECAKQFEGPVRICDVGTGSGCIAITLTKHIDGCNVTATDLSPEALKVALENAEIHQVAERIAFCESDLFESVPEGQFEIIVSNPPYIGTDEVDTVAEDVQRFEPESALYAGSDGLEVIRRLVAASPARLVSGGYLIFEASPIIMDRCVEIVNGTVDLDYVKTVKDLAGHARILLAKRNS